MSKALLFTGPGNIEFRDVEATPLERDQVRVGTMFSGISRGTEMTVYRGTSPFYKKGYDPQTMLFRQDQDPMWSYPLEFGYENVGRIVETGADVQGYAVGEIVFTPTSHRESLVMSATETGPFFGDLVPILRLPEGLSPESGVFLPLTGVAYNALLDGGVLLGESVAVFGAGVIGLITVQLLRLAGADQIFLVDPIASRRELAQRFGATHTFDPGTTQDLSLMIREATQQRGADLAIELSGSYAGLQEAIRSVGYSGRVVVSSYLAGAGEQLHLGEEFHHNRVRLISSQSFGVSPGISDRWDPGRRTTAAMKVLPRLDLAPMITHRFPFTDAARAFELVDQHPEEVLQVILEYEERLRP